MIRSEYIPGHPNYVVFEDGDVVNMRTGRVLSPGDNGQRSLHVYLSGGSHYKGRTVQVRKLVAEAFLPSKPSPDHVLTHIDNDYRNCSAENLAWETRSDIQFQSILRDSVGTPATDQVRIVETGEIFDNIFVCAKAIKGDAKQIHKCTLNSNWEYKGYHYEYI